jgi:hypothetical protein
LQTSYLLEAAQFLGWLRAYVKQKSKEESHEEPKRVTRMAAKLVLGTRVMIGRAASWHPTVRTRIALDIWRKASK